MVNVVVSSPVQEDAADGAERAAGWVRRLMTAWARSGSGVDVELVGPAPAPIERLHGRWRWHFLLRSPSSADLGAVTRALAVDFDLPAGDLRMAVDRDPVALL